MAGTVRTKTQTKVLIDEIRKTAVDEQTLRVRRRVVIMVILLLILLWAISFAGRLLKDEPKEYANIVDHFKYGSIGSEPGGSVFDAVGGLLPPYWIFAALPKICPDKLPGGYATFGFIGEEDHDMPIGVSQRMRLGFEQVGVNCAVCHVGTYRETRGGDPEIVLGMPAHGLNLQGFFKFIMDCTLDDRFNPGNVLAKMEEAGADPGIIDRLLYRMQVIPRTKETVGELNAQIEILLGDEVPSWGNGRVDTFNPYKAIQFNWSLDQVPIAELTGASDYPSLWNQKPRDGMQLHWDGNNNSVEERNLSASLGAGVTPVTIDHPRLKRVRDWIWTLPPPPYPFPIDPILAARGKTTYDALCASCHNFDGTRIGRVEPIEKIGSDPYRLNSYTKLFAANQYTLYPDSRYRFEHFRKTGGYANQPLDAIWARAPYLHNGSVPTLRDLLEPPEQRPKVFYRGDDLYDQKKAGFVSDVAEVDGRHFTEYDTSVPGNHNSGHVYGTRLTSEQKDALVEYMKTL